MFNGEGDVLPRADGIPSVAHQLRQTYARSSIYRSSSSTVQFAAAAASEASATPENLVGPFRAPP